MAFDCLAWIAVAIILLASLPIILAVMFLELLFFWAKDFVYKRSRVGRVCSRILADGPGFLLSEKMKWDGLAGRWFVFEKPREVCGYDGETRTLEPMRWTLPGFCMSKWLGGKEDSRLWRAVFFSVMKNGGWTPLDPCYNGGPSLIGSAIRSRRWGLVRMMMEMPGGGGGQAAWVEALRFGLWKSPYGMRLVAGGLRASDLEKDFGTLSIETIITGANDAVVSANVSRSRRSLIISAGAVISFCEGMGLAAPSMPDGPARSDVAMATVAECMLGASIHDGGARSEGFSSL